MFLMRLMVPPQELEACRSRLEILRERNSMFQEEVGGCFRLLSSLLGYLFSSFAEISLQLAKAAADRRAPGTPSPPATDSRVGSTTASGQQMQSAGLQGGAKNGEEAQEGDR